MFIAVLFVVIAIMSIMIRDLKKDNEDLKKQVRKLQEDNQTLRVQRDSAQQVVIDDKCLHVLECLEVNDSPTRRAIEQHDSEFLINQLVPVLQAKEADLFGLDTFKCIATAANSTRHKVAMLATVLAHAIIMVQHAELLMGPELNLEEFKKKDGPVYAIASINKMLDKALVGSTVIEIPRPQCLVGCTNQMPVTRRWAMAVAISIYLGDTSKFDAFKAA